MRTVYIFFTTIFIIATGNIALGQGSSVSTIEITEADLTVERVGRSIPASAIGEPVGYVRLYEPRWVEATDDMRAYGIVEGSMLPVDPNGWPINFRILLPAEWTRRSMQAGGGGNNGVITVREGNNPVINRGIATYGSDSGHQSGGGFGPPQTPLATGPGGVSSDGWSLNDEAIRNLGYMQMKKTHDAAMVIMERVYGALPQYNYYVGNSQGGREALTVAQRYPADYDGIIANVPIVNFSSLMLSPVLMRIREIPLENWVTPDKAGAIANEFIRQSDALDGLADGIINNYQAARHLFDVTDGVGSSDPWASLRGTNTGNGITQDGLGDGQIETMEFVYSPYRFVTPLANGVESFGMWTPTITPGGFGMITDTRYRGQAGADEDAPMFTHLGILGVKGFLMQDLDANPLDYERGAYTERRQQLSEWLDSTDPDLSAFYERGGKLIVTIGIMDNIASPGAQLDYYQSVLDRMGRETLDEFARLYVVPHGNHGLSWRSHDRNGNGEPVAVRQGSRPDPNENIDRIVAWVEEGQAPGKSFLIGEDGSIGGDSGGGKYLVCSYPAYPHYTGGPTDSVSSYTCREP